jgi:hypothetical protein
MKNIRSLVLAVLVTLAFAALPLIVDPEKSSLVYFLFLAFCYIVIAQA